MGNIAIKNHILLEYYKQFYDSKPNGQCQYGDRVIQGVFWEYPEWSITLLDSMFTGGINLIEVQSF
jgi:hypothetical protein